MTFVIIPLVSGKWCRVERYYVPETYIQALLASMPNAFINSARERRHLRPPVWREKSRVFHYKDHEVNDVISALSYQSSVPLELKKSYRGNMEVAASNELLTAQQALQAAKERARSKKSSTIPTRQIEIVVGNGEGRATREFEVIWWPDLFSDNKHGKLTLRFYVSKVILWFSHHVFKTFPTVCNTKSSWFAYHLGGIISVDFHHNTVTRMTEYNTAVIVHLSLNSFSWKSH